MTNGASNGTHNEKKQFPKPFEGSRRNRPYTQVVKLQDTLFDVVINNPPAKGSDLASLVRAWCDCEERRRVLCGTPLPGSRKPEPRQRRTKPVNHDLPAPTLPSTPPVVVGDTPLT